MKSLFKKPIFYLNVFLLIIVFLLATSVNVNQTNLPSFAKKVLAAVQSILGEGQLNYLAAFTATNQIGNSIIYDTGTNVGIGTTSPSNRFVVVNSDGDTLKFSDGYFSDRDGLTIIGNAAVSTGFNVQNTSSAGYSGLQMIDNTGKGIAHIGWGNSAKILEIGSDKNIVMNSNDPNFGVGIGTTAPTLKFQVQSGGYYVSLGNYGTLAGLKISDTSAVTGNAGAYLGHDFSSKITQIASTGAIAFYTDGLGTVDNVFYANTAGNVGIGTTNPGQKLDVSGNIRASGTICDSVGCIGDGGGSSLWTASGNNIYNSNTGNVGIGTTNPGERLTIGSGGSINVENGVIKIKTSYSGSTLQLFARDIRTSNNEDLYLNWTNDSGNVVIGGEGENKTLYLAGGTSYVDAPDYYIRNIGKWASQLGGAGGGVTSQTTASCKTSSVSDPQCTVTCPAGYFISGGGSENIYSVNPGGIESFRVRNVKMSKPSGNGWYCEWEEDYDADSRDKSYFVCYANCLK